MKLFVSIAAAVAVLLAAGISHAGSWGTGGCAPGGQVWPIASPPSPVGPEWGWRPLDGDPSQVALYRFPETRWQVQVGGYSFETRVFRPLAGGVWGDACQPPINPPPAPARARPAPVEEAPNFGVDRQGCGDRERFLHRGDEISRAEFRARLEAASLTDDSGKPWVVYVGGDFAAQLKGDWSLWRVCRYPADDWHAGGFKPGVTVMMPDGQVLFEGDVIGLTALVARLPPKWDASQLPALLRPKPPAPPEPPAPPAPAPDAPNHWILCGGCLALLVAIYVLKGKSAP